MKPWGLVHGTFLSESPGVAREMVNRNIERCVIFPEFVVPKVNIDFDQRFSKPNKKDKKNVTSEIN